LPNHPPRPTSGQTEPHPLAAPIFWLLVVLIVFTPLFRAGGTPLAALMTQLLSVAVLALVRWSPKRLSLTWPELFVLILLLLIPALYLVQFGTAQSTDALFGRTGGSNVFGPAGTMVAQAVGAAIGRAPV